MSWTYATLQAAILSYIESDEENLVANMPVIVQQAEDRILKDAQLSDFRKNVTGVMADGDQYLALPDDYLAPYSMAVIGGDFLLFKEVNFIRAAYPDSTNKDVPKYYSVFSSTFFLLGPTPDSNYDVELHYFYRPESIVTASTSWLGDNAESTLLYACLLEAYVYTKGEADLIETTNTRYKEAMANEKLLGEGRNKTDTYRNG